MASSNTVDKGATATFVELGPYRSIGVGLEYTSLSKVHSRSCFKNATLYLSAARPIISIRRYVNSDFDIDDFTRFLYRALWPVWPANENDRLSLCRNIL